ncbi:MAG: hypothetical protein K6E20_02575 [Acholeplasmatales bacterium]|nr:hypothetical protein [Acholeplasmatales bacterium]
MKKILFSFAIAMASVVALASYTYKYNQTEVTDELIEDESSWTLVTD